ncbi:hypothetical protein CD30_15970 [Ureibacillus massiliensis 4400831 = CIP 108448 = CCUG 49529]|uniref:DUF4367 domain-containing protein n=3 Tax=cellular organisms TaxID=131567 RepID=A0A0A3J1Q9_9BACL|nr:DUF4367 domain-containing protein [Ureibacillus massiliensis]KGR89650.1 hypothetical protein CD30_15970 [Ureibacillus massiliensis 4400831 = CIP 108448 = CCUG 49529]
MKKIGLFLAGVLVILMLAACGKASLDKSEVLAKSIEASADIHSYSIEMDMDIDMDDMKQSVSMKGDITHNPDMIHLNMNMDMLGMNMDIETYLNQDEAYMSMMGEWMEMDPSELGLESFDQINKEEMEKLTKFTEQFEMTEEENQYVLKLSGNDETYRELIEDVISSSMGEVSADPYMEELINSIKIKNLNLEYHIDKETFIHTMQVFDIELEMVDGDTTTPLNIKGELTTSNINGVEPIVIPDEVKESAVTEDEMYPYSDSMSVEELQELVSYEIVEPSAVPEGYIFTEGYYDETMDMVTISYDKDFDNWIMLTMNPIEVFSLADVEGESIEVRGTEGIIYDMEGYLSISWEENGLLYEVGGMGTDLTIEQLLEVAESI